MMPSRKGPDSGSLFCFEISLMAAVCSNTRSACATICVPSGVIEISVPPRSKMTTPSSSSSFLMATDKVGCATKQASAAWPKCLWRATATMYLSSVRVISVSSHRRGNYSLLLRTSKLEKSTVHERHEKYEKKTNSKLLRLVSDFDCQGKA